MKDGTFFWETKVLCDDVFPAPSCSASCFWRSLILKKWALARKGVWSSFQRSAFLLKQHEENKRPEHRSCQYCLLMQLLLLPEGHLRATAWIHYMWGLSPIEWRSIHVPKDWMEKLSIEAIMAPCINVEGSCRARLMPWKLKYLQHPASLRPSRTCTPFSYFGQLKTLPGTACFTAYTIPRSNKKNPQSCRPKPWWWKRGRKALGFFCRIAIYISLLAEKKKEPTDWGARNSKQSRPLLCSFFLSGA